MITTIDFNSMEKAVDYYEKHKAACYGRRLLCAWLYGGKTVGRVFIGFFEDYCKDVVEKWGEGCAEPMLVDAYGANSIHINRLTNANENAVLYVAEIEVKPPA